MKKLYFLLFTLGSFAVLLSGCKKNIPVATLHTPESISNFTVSNSTIVLSNANDSQFVASFNWKKPDYGFNATISYTLLIDLPSDTSGTSAWGNAQKTTIPTDSLGYSWLGTDFNSLLNRLGLDPGSAGTIVVRLKADVNQSTGSPSAIPTLYTDLSMTVTPYKITLNYPKLYVAGDFLTPNWTPAEQPGWILASVKSNGSYEGYVWFPNAGNSFKLCSEPDWNGTAYGWGGSATTILAGASGNCYSSGPAYARVIADVNAGTISLTPTSWFVSGDFNSWSTTAGQMTFNPATNQWTISGVSMKAGDTFKFAGDSGWNTSFGLDDKGNLVFNGGNITAAQTGTFTVTLDLSGGAGNYIYSVK